MRLDDLTWTDLDGAGAALLAVPVGSTEQHGPHLPLSTDTDIAVGLCSRLAAARPDVVVAPALAYGSAGEHAGFAGTLSIGQSVTRQVLVEIGRSADRFAGVVFVSTHGGNAAALSAAVRRLDAEGRPARAWSPRGSVDAHAGRTETSVMLALRPDAVRVGAAAPGCRSPLASIMAALESGGVASLSPNGVLGDPSGANAGEGEAVLAGWAADLVASLRGWPA